jgi:hypothetical protein
VRALCPVPVPDRACIPWMTGSSAWPDAGQALRRGGRRSGGWYRCFVGPARGRRSLGANQCAARRRIRPPVVVSSGASISLSALVGCSQSVRGEAGLRRLNFHCGAVRRPRKSSGSLPRQDRAGAGAAGLKGCWRERTCQAAIRILRATAALAGFLLAGALREVWCRALVPRGWWVRQACWAASDGRPRRSVRELGLGGSAPVLVRALRTGFDLSGARPAYVRSAPSTSRRARSARRSGSVRCSVCGPG